MLRFPSTLATAFRRIAMGGLIFMTPLAASADDGGKNGGQWTMGGQSLGNWRNQDDTKISPQNVAKLTTKWVFTTGGDVSATPAVANGIVYFPDFAGNFYAVNAASGALVWKHQLADWTGVAGDYARNDPAIYSGMVILGNQGGNNAFWNGSQYLGGGGARVMAVDASTGALKWMTVVEAFPTAMVTSSPVINNGVVYVGIASAEENSASVAGTPCCVSRGSVVALDVNTGQIRWKTYMVPDNGGVAGGYSGGGVWDSTPVVDVTRNSLYVGTGNNYQVPVAVQQCFAANNNNPNCTDPADYFDAVVSLDLDTGAIKWAKRALYYDAWNVNCIQKIVPPPNFSITPGPGPNCPTPAGPDYDFGGTGPQLFKARGHDIVGIGEKSGIYWAFDPDNGNVIWSTPVGPGSALGGIEWGTATDGKRIYVPISNPFGVPYQLQPEGVTVNGGSWAALDPATGSFLWQTATPGACSPPVPNAARGCMGLGPASVANGVVYAGSMDTSPGAPTMFALDAKTGKILWSFAAGSSVIAGPAIVENSIYWGSGYGRFGPSLGTPNNKLYAFTIPSN
jgi:polyvinyl alcohol dehydrogenase (cytochrome)